MKELEEKMQKTIDSTKEKLMTIRTGRANPDILCRIQVDYYGTPTPINQVSRITTTEGNTLLINVFDSNAIDNVTRAIQQSDLNLNPQTEGNLIRLRLPDLTEDRRNNLVKIVKEQGEEGKIALRHLRRDFLDKYKKDDDATEDDLKGIQGDIQKITDKYTGIIESLCKEKEHEITTL